MNIDEILRNALTPQQFNAAMDKSKTVLCLACAGSGKSRTLAYRIARLIGEGEPPEGIVAFTFTEKAAESIKRRVSEALEKAGFDPTLMGAMYIGTIHAFCQRVLGNIDPSYRQFTVLDENGLKLYLISRYYRLSLQTLRTNRQCRYFEVIKQVSEAWKTANDELLDFGDIEREDPELGQLLFQIQSSLNGDQYLDFSSMIRNVVEAISNNINGIEKGIGQLRHLMVDEYQDVNPCQEELIRLLQEKAISLFVVGDDDQSIYAWRGADVSNILEFGARYSGSGVHALSQNFRSTEAIVRTSDRFVSEMLGPSRYPKNPTASNDRQPQDLRVIWFSNRTEEAQWVADRIQTLLGTAYEENGVKRGLTPADFAILMRSTRSKEATGSPRHAAFTQALQTLGIPFSLEAGGGVFDRPQVEVLRSTFELLRNVTLDRDELRQYFNLIVTPAYPNANFNDLVRVLADWGRKVHRPTGTTRIRLYPQELVYELLEAFKLSQTNFSDEVMREIGLFSRMILDIETVYMSVDSGGRFSEILNFLQNLAESGYDVSTDDVLQRPDAVTVSTVHKMKGLEFPCVFVVDVEANRFPKKRSKYSGWLPETIIENALNRGSYRSTLEEEIRLFYTAATRAERILYVSGAKDLPNAKRPAKESPFSRHLIDSPGVQANDGLPIGLEQAPPRRRVDDSDYPTNFTEIKYYLRCPKSYQFRERYGFNPVISEMFGFGQTVHTSIQKLHDQYLDQAPIEEEIEEVVRETFHLKHVPPSGDPVNRPGAYETSQNRAVQMAKNYVEAFGADFERERQVEAVFEIPAPNCVISGSIDLLLHEDENGSLLQAEIIDFKTMEGGEKPESNDSLDWTELALQVQLYTRAAEQILGQNAKTGSIHLLKDNQRVEVPIDSFAVGSALENIEWAVSGILASDFPMRPHQKKCEACDFVKICPRTPQEFSHQKSIPPEIHIPNGKEMARAFSLFKPL
jgi:DNA helicase II / ATP-dependent DNA helicase PcrA